MRKTFTFLVVGAFAALMIAACSDPTSGMTKAQTGDAAEVEAVEGVTLTFSNQGSKIGFLGSKVTGSHTGGFHKFTGQAVLSDDGSQVRQVEVDIDMSSIWTDDPEKPNARLTGHLKTDDFFDVPNNPAAKFVSTDIKNEEGSRYTVTGNLTMRGVTKSVTFPATIEITDGKLKTKAEFSINRQEWNVSYAGMQDDLIRDNVGLTLDINAA